MFRLFRIYRSHLYLGRPILTSAGPVWNKPDGISDSRDSEADEVRLLECADPSQIDGEAGCEFHLDLWIHGIHRKMEGCPDAWKVGFEPRIGRHSLGN
jgi:hypothetical protein